MASHGLRDHDRLHGASNYVIWKTRTLVVLEEYDLEAYIKSVVVVPADNNQKKKYNTEQGKAKRLILKGVRDHVVSHLQGKGTTREMWEALSSLYEDFSQQWKIHLEQKLQRTLMQKGEGVNLYLQCLQDTRGQLGAIGSAPQSIAMVRTTLNGLSDEWQVFVQSILGGERLPSWEET